MEEQIKQQYRALYSYSAVDNSEISFDVDDILFLYGEYDDSGWYLCYNVRTKKIGLVPAEYVEIIDTIDSKYYNNYLPKECYRYQILKEDNNDNIINENQENNLQSQNIEQINKFNNDLTLDAINIKTKIIMTDKIWICEKLLSKNETLMIINTFTHNNHNLSSHNSIYCPLLTESIFKRLFNNNEENNLQSFLLTLNINSKPVGINPFIRFSILNNSDNELPYHTDSSFRNNNIIENDKLKHSVSLFSILIYLNNTFTGGNLIFSDNGINPIHPKEGKCVIFDQKLCHKGEKISNGEKCFIRTDLLFENT